MFQNAPEKKESPSTATCFASGTLHANLVGHKKIVPKKLVGGGSRSHTISGSREQPRNTSVPWSSSVTILLATGSWGRQRVPAAQVSKQQRDPHPSANNEAVDPALGDELVARLSRRLS